MTDFTANWELGRLVNHSPRGKGGTLARRTFEEQSRESAEKTIIRAASWGVVAASLVLVAVEAIRNWRLPGTPPAWSIAVAAVIGLLAIAGIYWLSTWKYYRIPREVPLWFRLRAPASRIALNESILRLLFRRSRPPLFVVGKDQQHIVELQHPKTALKRTRNLKSLKCASGNDLHYLCRLAHVAARHMRPSAGELLPAMRKYPLGATGVSVVEGKVKRRGRSVVCAGGSDTNPLSAEIVRSYSRFWGGYPPLRFTLSTSEVILARTKRSFQVFWENENAEQAMDRTGLLFCCAEPRWLPRRVLNRIRERRHRCAGDPNWTGRAVQVVLAGLHREGTKASCEVFAHLAVRSAADLQGEPLQTTYWYSNRLSLPFAITRLAIPADGADPQVLLQDHGNLAAGFNRDAPQAVDPNAPPGPPPAAGSTTRIVIGRAHRDYQDQAERDAHKAFQDHIQLSEACRAIDLIVRYSLAKDVAIETRDDSVWDVVTGEPTDPEIEEFFTGAEETVLIGTPEQNDYARRLIGLPAGVGTLQADVAALRAEISQHATAQNPVGGFHVAQVFGAAGPKVVIVLGIGLPPDACGANGIPHYDRDDRTTNCAARATQAAIVGLLKELTDPAPAAPPGSLRRIRDLAAGSYVYRIQNRDCMYPTDEDVRRL